MIKILTLKTKDYIGQNECENKEKPGWGTVILCLIMGVGIIACLALSNESKPGVVPEEAAYRHTFYCQPTPYEPLLPYGEDCVDLPTREKVPVEDPCLLQQKDLVRVEDYTQSTPLGYSDIATTPGYGTPLLV